MKKQKMHYAWWVVISCVLLKIGLGGAVMSIGGNFVTPVVNELSTTVSQFTMLISVEAAAMAFMYTTAAKIISLKNTGFVMGIAAIAQVIGIAAMATYNNVFLFYISGAVIGVGVAFTGFVAIPIVVNMWFKKKAGTVLGIIIAAENISMVLFTVISAQFITEFGWRNAYLILALISLVVSVPCLFLFVKTPKQAGVLPYGYDEGEEEVAHSEIGITKKQAFKTPVFYIIWFTCMLFSVGSGVQQYIANYSTMEMGFSISEGSLAAMILSIGCIISSLALGKINDKFGAKAGLAFGALFVTLGYGTILLLDLNYPILLTASLLIGIGGSMYTVQCPLIVKSTLGTRDYSSIWSVMMMGNSLVGALSFSSIGLFYDVGGSYNGAFIMVIVLYISAFVIGSFAINKSRKLVI